MTSKQQSILARLAIGDMTVKEIAYEEKTSVAYVHRTRRRLKQGYFNQPVKRRGPDARRVKPSKDYSGNVECLCCEKDFFSPDKRHIRICDRCKELQRREEEIYAFEPAIDFMSAERR